MRVRLGHSDGISDVASVVTVRIVLNLPPAPELRLFPIPGSRRLEYVLMSVRLLDAIDWFVVESAMDTRVGRLKDGMSGDSPAPEVRSERSDGRERKGERGGRIGGTSSRSLVRVGVSCPSVSAPGAVPASLDEETTTSELTGRNVGRPTEGGVHRLVLARVGEHGECGGECAGRLGEDITASDEEPV